MPNMFGGDQHHPAYDPRTKLSDNQVLCGNTLYTVDCEGTVTYEAVNGSTGVAVGYPDEVAALRRRILAQGK